MMLWVKIISVVCMTVGSPNCATTTSEIELKGRSVGEVCQEAHKNFKGAAENNNLLLMEFRCFPTASKRKI